MCAAVTVLLQRCIGIRSEISLASEKPLSEIPSDRSAAPAVLADPGEAFIPTASARIGVGSWQRNMRL